MKGHDVSCAANRLPATVGVIVAIGLCAALGAAALSGCAPKETGTTSAQEKGSGSMTVAWSADMECSSCHAAEAKSQTDTACLASKHVQETCESCHGSADKLATIHADASAADTMPTKLSKANAVSEEACLSCHGSWEELASKSTAVAVLTDADGTVVNPHAMDRTGDHEVITCTGCHVEHKQEKDQKEFCLSCHHEDVFECRTCHE